MTQMIMMNADSETHSESKNWKPYYMALAVWLVVQIAFYWWVSVKLI
jgi:hypothetical protein